MTIDRAAPDAAGDGRGIWGNRGPPRLFRAAQWPRVESLTARQHARALPEQRRCPICFLGGSRSRRLDLAQPPLEKSALGVVGDQRERSRITRGRLRRGSEATQEIGPRGVQQVIAVEVAGGGERVDE